MYIYIYIIFRLKQTTNPQLNLKAFFYGVTGEQNTVNLFLRLRLISSVLSTVYKYKYIYIKKEQFSKAK